MPQRIPPPTTIPASDITGPGGRNRLQANPMTIPGSVMRSGRI
jgi:hypothetical protein